MVADIESRTGSKKPVARINVDTINLPNGAAAEVTVTEGFNGVIGTICVDFENATNAITGTLEVRDSDGFILYPKAGIAENVKTILDVNVLVAGTLTIGFLPSGDPGAGGVDVNIILYAV